MLHCLNSGKNGEFMINYFVAGLFFYKKQRKQRKASHFLEEVPNMNQLNLEIESEAFPENVNNHNFKTY